MALVGCAVEEEPQALREDVDALAEQVVALETALAAQQAAAEARDADVAALQGDVAALEAASPDALAAQVTGLDARLAAVEGAGYATETWVEEQGFATEAATDALADRQDTAEEYIDNLGALLLTHGTTLTAHEGAIGDLEASALAHGTTLGQHGGAIGDLQTASGDHTDAIGDLQATVGGHTDAIGDLEGTVGDHTDAIGDLEGTVGDHTDAIGDLEVTVGEQGDAIGDLVGELGVLDETVGAHATAILTHGEVLDDLDGRVAAAEDAVEAALADVADLQLAAGVPVYADQADASADGVFAWFDFETATCGGAGMSNRMGTGDGTCLGTGASSPGLVGRGIHRGTATGNGFAFALAHPLGTFTVSFWWHTTDYTIYSANDGAGILWVSGEANEDVIGFNGDPIARALKWGAWARGDGDDPALEGVYSGVQLQAGQWTQIALSMDGTQGTSALYVNGSLVATNNARIWTLGPQFYLANYTLPTGGNTNAHYARELFDELVVYDRVLSASEIARLFRDQRSGRPLFE